MGHWYTQDGAPQHWITGKNGKERATDLRDARKLNLAPSVTTIIKGAAAPQLTNWLVNQAYMQALTTPARDGETLDQYIKRCKAAEAAELERTADIGSAIHKAIEDKFLGRRPREHAESADAVFDLVHHLTGQNRGWIPEKTFTSPLGFGGAVDLHHQGGVVIDYKTKDFTEETADKRMAYDNHAMQMAAYAHGLGMPDARLINIFVSRQVPGLVRYHEWSKPDAEKGWKKFSALLDYWQASTGHKPTINGDSV